MSHPPLQTPHKFRYYLVDEDFIVTGTDDTTVAVAAADECRRAGVGAVIDNALGSDLTIAFGDVPAAKIVEQTARTLG